jgi:hypothetical protein
MSDIVQVTESLRVRDYDAHQYVVERRTQTPNKKTGEYGWGIISYCGGPKSASVVVMRELGMLAADAARKQSDEAYLMGSTGAEIEALPEKPARPKATGK